MKGQTDTDAAGGLASGSGGVDPATGSGRRSARDLIAEARRQAGSGSGRASLPMDLPSDFFPGYEIIREIHRGGQGVVYQAIQKSTKRKVAIKLLFEGLAGGSRGRARFDREVEILAQMNHPNIVSVIDSGHVGPSYFIVMDYISGQPLDSFIAGGPRSMDETLELFAKICDAVNSAHLKGVIHRDLKPGNIRVDPQGEPHVLDFGLAKVGAGETTETSRLMMMTMTGQFIGSLPWASPEQAEGVPDKIDIRTDVYSLGVVLYQMLTGGKFPYSVVGNMRDVLDNILKAEPEKPSTVRRQINDEVETIVLKALSKERDRRYQSAGELGRDVRHYLCGEPIEAKRDSGWYFLKKAARRHRTAAGVAAAFVMLAGAGSALGWVLYTKADEAEQKAVVALGNEAEQRKAAEDHRDKIVELAVVLAGASEKLENLRGATATRRYILDESLKVVAKLELRQDESPAFLRGVATVKQGIGEISAALYAPSTREFERGKKELEEALAMREKVVAALPGDWRAHAELAQSHVRHSEIFQRLRQFNEAIAAADRSVAAATEAARLAGADAAASSEAEVQLLDARRRRIDAGLRLAVEEPERETSRPAFETALREYEQLEKIWGERFRASPGDENVVRQFGTLTDKRAKAHIELGRSLRDQYMNKGKEMQPEQAERLKLEAVAQLTRGRDIAAQAEKLFSEALKQVPTNRKLARDVVVARLNAGIAIQELGRLARRVPLVEGKTPEEHYRELTSESLDAWFRPALTMAQGLQTSDEANTEAWRDVVLAMSKVGTQLEELDRVVEAGEIAEGSLRIRRELFRADPTPMARRDVAIGLVKMGDLARSRADLLVKQEKKEDAIGQYTAAEVFYEQAQAEFGVLRDEKAMAPDAREIKAMDEVIGKVRARKDEMRKALGGG
jgi:tetratricopeptide (TPR) repeat protein